MGVHGYRLSHMRTHGYSPAIENPKSEDYIILCGELCDPTYGAAVTQVLRGKVLGVCVKATPFLNSRILLTGKPTDNAGLDVAWRDAAARYTYIREAGKKTRPF